MEYDSPVQESWASAQVKWWGVGTLESPCLKYIILIYYEVDIFYQFENIHAYYVKCHSFCSKM